MLTLSVAVTEYVMVTGKSELEDKKRILLLLELKLDITGKIIGSLLSLGFVPSAASCPSVNPSPSVSGLFGLVPFRASI